MNNRKAQSAAGPRAAETYIVDLTSVCLSSGTLRLPLSLLGRFSEGQHRVFAGGEELTIEFEAPRTLSGLALFFNGSELRANDRVRFLFDGERLELEAQKRDRPRSSAPAERAVMSQVLTASQRAASAQTSNGGSRIPQRGLFAEPAQLIEAPLMGASGGASAPAETAPVEAGMQDPQPTQIETTIKAVRRVRIEGGVAPRTDTVSPRPLDRASAHEVWARRQQPSWRALDTMVAGPVVDPEEAAEAFSDSIVRVVRRSKGTVTPLAAEIPPLRPKPAPEEVEGRTPMSYSMTWPLPETPREKRKARPADVPTPQPARQAEVRAEAASLASPYIDPYLDAPIDADSDQYVATTPAILESDLLSLPTSGRWREASEEAYLKYQEAQHASAQEPVAAPAGRRGGFLERLGFGRGTRDGGSAGAPRSGVGSPGWSGSGGAARTASNTDNSGSSRHDPQGEPVPVRVHPAPGAGAGPTAAHQNTASQALLIVDEAVYDVDFDTVVTPQAAPADTAEGSLEDDMAALNVLLEQPDIPAIVRCDDLAARLQISPQRVSRAMLRLSEDRERFTPLRGDAYMVRRRV